MRQFPSLSCPVCQQALTSDPRSLRCPQGHSFDRAKEGYVNLLLANRKRSASPGDSRDMMLARRQFLRAGHYQSLWQRLVGLINQLASGHSAQLLDLGCGEGFYTDAISRNLAVETAAVNAIDISRDGIKMAAKAYIAPGFIVGSTYQLPYVSASQGIAWRIFAPADDGEVARVLEQHGIYLVVNPGPSHLAGLKALIYDAPTQHDTTLVNHPQLRLIHEEVLEFPLQLTGQSLQDLFMMTPFFWNVGVNRQAELQRLEQLESPAAFHISVYRRDASGPSTD